MGSRKISEIRELLTATAAPELLAELRGDERAGVQKLLAAYDRRLAREAAERERWYGMTAYERALYGQGARHICGVDEAGRGPLAGPLAVAAVILPPDAFISGLNDSKKLSAKKREELYEEILTQALAVSVNLVSVSNIDSLNIYQATKEGMAQVISHLAVRPQAALLDAMPLELPGIRTQSVVHGDALSVSIAAASIVAKVTRDRLMLELDALCPEYGFAANKGYGSQQHMDALARCGATKYHRRSYEPVKSMGLAPAAPEENILYSPMTEQYHYEWR